MLQAHWSAWGFHRADTIRAFRRDASPMSSHPRAFLLRLALLLAGLSMFGPFAIDAIFPAFPELQEAFSVSHAAVQQSISVYLIAYALMSVFHGPVWNVLSHSASSRRVSIWETVLKSNGTAGFWKPLLLRHWPQRTLVSHQLVTFCL